MHSLKQIKILEERIGVAFRDSCSSCLHRGEEIVPNVTGEDDRTEAMIIILGMALGHKLLYSIIVLYKSLQCTTLKEPAPDVSGISDGDEVLLGGSISFVLARGVMLD